MWACLPVRPPHSPTPSAHRILRHTLPHSDLSRPSKPPLHPIPPHATTVGRHLKLPPLPRVVGRAQVDAPSTPCRLPISGTCMRLSRTTDHPSTRYPHARRSFKLQAFIERSCAGAHVFDYADQTCSRERNLPADPAALTNHQRNAHLLRFVHALTLMHPHMHQALPTSHSAQVARSPIADRLLCQLWAGFASAAHRPVNMPRSPSLLDRARSSPLDP